MFEEDFFAEENLLATHLEKDVIVSACLVVSSTLQL